MHCNKNNNYQHDCVFSDQPSSEMNYVQPIQFFSHARVEDLPPVGGQWVLGQHASAAPLVVRIQWLGTSPQLPTARCTVVIHVPLVWAQAEALIAHWLVQYRYMATTIYYCSHINSIQILNFGKQLGQGKN